MLLSVFMLRDLFDLTKDNIQIKENKAHGIILHGVTDVRLLLQEYRIKFYIYC